ncbi:mitogen-activated protein kinase 7-like [Cervus elaphus]|uniref:mitogen-activated protein kinase 7-like n=1 Tax=Cervus canadensis TaxID=1574408 RepID=UPI001C9E504C|nr:mitogen-activated protein kinase 7-like [Cervus canadensis]XP_043778735.1 mitogen-activated protein kinase 7-like [Cervus elaphus]
MPCPAPAVCADNAGALDPPRSYEPAGRQAAPSQQPARKPPGPRPSPISEKPPRSARVTSFKPSRPRNLLGAERPNVIAHAASACLSPTPRRPLCPSGLDWTLAEEWESGWGARP